MFLVSFKYSSLGKALAIHKVIPHHHLGHSKLNWTRNWPLSQLSNLMRPGTFISVDDCHSFKHNLTHYWKDAALRMGTCLPKLLVLAPNSISRLQTCQKFVLGGARCLWWHMSWYLTKLGPPLGRALFKKHLMFAKLWIEKRPFFWLRTFCMLVNSQYGWDSTFVLLGTKITED